MSLLVLSLAHSAIVKLWFIGGGTLYMRESIGTLEESNHSAIAKESM